MLIDCVVMCGGLGTRLKPFTYLIPKPFLTSNDISPFDYTLNNITILNLIKKIYVTIHYKSDLVEKIINKKKISNLLMIKEKKPLGTAGSLKTIIKYSKSKHLLIINGDVFSKINYKKLIYNHIKNNSDLTVCIKEHQIRVPYAVLTKKNNKISFKEKPSIKKKINTGIYVVSVKFLKDFFKKNKQETIGMDKVLKYSNKINLFDIGKKWIDIGHISDFKRAFNEIRDW